MTDQIKLADRARGFSIGYSMTGKILIEASVKADEFAAQAERAPVEWTEILQMESRAAFHASWACKVNDDYRQYLLTIAGAALAALRQYDNG
jgi:hypothetical protein